MAGRAGVWNADFNKVVPDGAAGHQAMLGIFYVDDRGEIQRLTSAEGNEISYNPETEEMNLIGQEAPETLVRTYNLSFDKDIRIRKSDTDYEFFANYARLRPSGENAKLHIYLTDFRLEEVGADHNKYYAESMTVTCTVNTANETEGTLSVSFAQAGDFTTGIMQRTDSSTSDDPTTFTYGFTPSNRITITAIETSARNDEVEVKEGEQAVVAISFSPLGAPFDFTIESGDEDKVRVERRRQSVVIRGREATSGTPVMVTVTSTADTSQKAEIEVTVV